VALTAWHQGMPDVESRSVTSLSQELKKQKVEPLDDPDAVLELFPPRRESEAAWAARRAIVEYVHRQPLDFQGTGDVVLRTGEGLKGPDAGSLIAGLTKMLGGDGLPDLLDPPAGSGKRTGAGNGTTDKWLPSASKTADSERVNGFRVTRVDQDIAAKKVE